MIKLFLLVCLTATDLLAQNIKIGDIAVSDSLAKKYFLDCYQHPDTIRNQPYSNGDWFDQKFKKSIGWYDPNQKKTSKIYKSGDSITFSFWGNPFDGFIIVPRDPTAADFRDWFFRITKTKGKTH